MIIINSGVKRSAEMLHVHFVMHRHALFKMKVIHFGKVLHVSPVLRDKSCRQRTFKSGPQGK